MENQSVFVEEINFQELKFLEVVGRGAFGVVSRAKWRNVDVAVKHIATEAEKKAFITELKQLSRVNHPNIVTLYGACTQPTDPICLVMEYAEGGSLYNVLHGETVHVEYTASHAISWCLQCAQGVAYLHDMKPKPLIHRDLKPPNLLLVQRGTVLKICDFGTACDAHTHMTNNKGSAAWMAPEVFEGSVYSEKCDVFSFGIILWEVITRRKPFDDIGGPAFRIMWAVHQGKRPPLIQGLPKPMESLMTRCWSANPVKRPDMTDVVHVMESIFKYFASGADEPLIYPEVSPEDNTDDMPNSVYDTPPPTNMSAHHATVKQIGDIVPIMPTTPKAKPMVVEEEQPHRRTSAPASLAASRDDLQDKSSRSSTPSMDFVNKRFSADLSKLDEIDILNHSGQAFMSKKPVHGHRRTGSHGTPFIISSHANSVLPSQPQVRGHRRTGSYGNTPANPAELVNNNGEQVRSHGQLHHTVTAPGSLGGPSVPSSIENGVSTQRSVSWTPGVPLNLAAAMPPASGTRLMSDPAENMAFIAMDNQLQPLAPSTSSPESMKIFEEHCRIAQEYMRMQTEIALLQRRKEELQKMLQEEDKQNPNCHVEEYRQLMSENESLSLLYKNLKTQVELIRKEQKTYRPEALR